MKNGLRRIDKNRLTLVEEHPFEVTVFANENVNIEREAVDELNELLTVGEAASRLYEHDHELFKTAPAIERVAITPDFHKGHGVPIGTVLMTRGFVIPQAVGTDVNCGMRAHVTSLTADRLLANIDSLKKNARHSFFEGGRDIPMTRVQRERLFKDGLLGLIDATPKNLDTGLWSLFHRTNIWGDLDKVHMGGSFPSSTVFGLEDFLGRDNELTRDAQIGSIGGGNHFVEFQRVSKILNGGYAHAFGLKLDQVVVMIHTGSVSIGHMCGKHFSDIARRTWPKGLSEPEHKTFVIPDGFGKSSNEFSAYFNSLWNAANFAFANRMFLGLMAWKCLLDTCGDVDFDLLYDAPHNLVWFEQKDGNEVFVHRKGACPARGPGELPHTPYNSIGEPVLVPGSMGAPSFILVGSGNADALKSACHGAGRKLSRGGAMRVDEDDFQEFLKKFHIVLPVDIDRPDIRSRRDIREKLLDGLRQESPFAYKDVMPAIHTLEDSGIAHPVAELEPIVTLKGK